MKRSVLVTLLCGTAALGQGTKNHPKIIAPALCGVVTNLAGVPIEKVSVGAMWADFGNGTRTDAQGRWSFGSGTGPHWVQVQADGFEEFVFDYVELGDEGDSGADKPAFIRPPKDVGCSKPIYVRLAPAGSHKGFVTLDATKGLKKESKSLDAAQK